MSFSSWLRSLRPSRRNCPAGRSRAAPRCRPRLEALEDRAVPAQITLTVSSLADAGPDTLRAAILAATGKPSDQFTINVSVKGTIDLQSPLPDLAASISVQGPGRDSLTVERAATASFTSAIVTVDADQTVSLAGLTIADGNAGGIRNNGGTLTVTNCAVVNNTGVNEPLGGRGGGIRNSGGSLMVSGSTVSGNSAADGGGIWDDFGSLTISDSFVSDNVATGFDIRSTHTPGSGGGIGNNNGVMTVNGGKISGNSTDGHGGGISNAGSLTVSGCTLSGNSALVGGGIDGGDLTISSSTLCGNSAADGGGIRCVGTLTVHRCIFTGNSATAFNLGDTHIAGTGGGIAIDFGNVTVQDSSFIGNSAELGGGIYNAPGSFSAELGNSLTVSGSTFTSNSATEGGAIYNDPTGTLVVKNCNLGTSPLTGNTAVAGGGIYNLGNATVQDSNLLGNSATSAGGGIFNDASGTLTVDDSVVVGNVALLGADLENLGVFTLNDSTVGVSNS
jgi:hypothetical protein